jgi:hypothetical protein
MLECLPLTPIWAGNHVLILVIAMCHCTCTFHWDDNRPVFLQLQATARHIWFGCKALYRVQGTHSADVDVIVTLS